MTPSSRTEFVVCGSFGRVAYREHIELARTIIFNHVEPVIKARRSGDTGFQFALGRVTILPVRHLHDLVVGPGNALPLYLDPTQQFATDASLLSAETVDVVTFLRFVLRLRDTVPSSLILHDGFAETLVRLKCPR